MFALAIAPMNSRPIQVCRDCNLYNLQLALFPTLPLYAVVGTARCGSAGGLTLGPRLRRQTLFTIKHVAVVTLSKVLFLSPHGTPAELPLLLPPPARLSASPYDGHLRLLVSICSASPFAVNITPPTDLYVC